MVRAPHATALLCAAWPGRGVGADLGCRGWFSSAEPGQHLLEFLQRCWQLGMGLNYLVIALLCGCGPWEQDAPGFGGQLCRTSNMPRDWLKILTLSESAVLVPL